MLNEVVSRVDGGADGRPAPTQRWRSVAAALPPTARVAHLPMVALTMALGAVPALVSVVRDGPSTGPLLVATLVTGSALAWAADDPAANLLGSLPVPSPARAMLRLASVATIALVGLVATLVLLAVGRKMPDGAWDRLPEGAAAATIALAVALVAVRRGEQQAAPLGITAGIIGTGTIAVIAFRAPKLLPSFLPGPTHDRWWIVAAVGFVVAFHAGRDPGRH